MKTVFHKYAFAFYIFRVTVVKDKFTRRSKGVAFVLFLERDSAHKCVHAVNNTQVCAYY